MILHSAGTLPAQRAKQTQLHHQREMLLQQALNQHAIQERVRRNALAAQLQIYAQPPARPFIVRRYDKPKTRPLGSMAERRIQRTLNGLWHPEYIVDPLKDGGKWVGRQIQRSTPQVVSESIDAVATLSLIDFSYVRSSKAFMAYDKQTQGLIFDVSSELSTSILLKEFATGTGPEHRHFYAGQRITDDFLTGYVIRDVVEGLYKQSHNQRITYRTFFSGQESIEYGLSFSPDSAGLEESYNKHKDSNKIQLFIGGASVIAKPTPVYGVVSFEIKNGTSRSSLLLHVADNYTRRGTDHLALSTIYQHFHFMKRINPSEFYERPSVWLNRSKRLY